MCSVFCEGNLQFDFSSCGTAERFDVGAANPYGMKSVDFVVDSHDATYFIEVKDYQNPNAPPERRRLDGERLLEAGKEGKSIFNLEIGCKIKDSLLREYASGKTFTKKVVCLLLINLDNLGAAERGRLKEKINGHIPSGLNENRFGNFSEISFEIVNAKQLERHGIVCRPIGGTT
jgi:hypothetical protein